MRRMTYGVGWLKWRVRVMEREYGMTSEEFYVNRLAGNEEALSHIPRFQRHVWATFYRELQSRTLV